MTSPAERAAQLRTEYRRVFGSAEGRAVLRDLAQLAVIGQAYETNDPLLAANVEGRRHLFWRIYRMVYLEAKEPRKNVAPPLDFTTSPFEEVIQ